MSRMNHDYIAEQDFVGRYMAGTLPSDERERFEAHFVDCPRCLDALEDVDPFQNALSAFAIEKTALAPVAATAPVPVAATAPAASTTPARRWPAFVFRAAALAAVVVIAVGVVVEFARMQRELARAAAEAEISGRQLGESEQRIRELSARNAQRTERLETSAPSGALVFPLVKARGAASDPPHNVVTLSGSPVWVILLADLDARPTSNRYRATIDTVTGLRVWSDDRLAASSGDSIAVGVPSTSLASGDYVLTLDQQAVSSDEWRPAGRFAFRVVFR
jgi:murein DD-endopeptidase MepM/ murein hydrolase activator NlpD